MLDFKELEAFVWAVRLGSFRKAAMRLHLTQPSISERISRLESSVGEVLLERSARPIQPTMRGREFFVHAERLLQQRDAAMKLFEDEENYSAPLRLGAIETIAHSWLPDFMRCLTQRYPQLTIELSVDYSPALNRRLAKNDLDILLAMNGYLEPERIDQEPLSPYEMGMFVSPDHVETIAVQGSEWLGCLPFISFGKRARPYEELVEYLDRQGVAEPRIHSVSTLMTIVRMTTEGLGVGALPVATVLDEWRQGQLYRIELPQPLPDMHYDVIWRIGSHPRFCRSVGLLAQQCAKRYAESRMTDMTTSDFSGRWVRPKRTETHP